MPPARRPSAASTSDVPRVLRLFLIVLASLFAFEWAFALINTYITHLPYPFTSPLSKPGYHFTDWLNYIPHAAQFGQPHFLLETSAKGESPFAYPLPCMYVYLIFYKLAPLHNLALYIVFTALSLVLVTLLFSFYLKRLGASRIFQLCTWATLALAVPAPFLLERGNFEVFVWLLVAAGLAAFLKDWKYAAAIFFALAICAKIYPALFLLLFIPRRQYWPILLSCVTVVVVFLASLAGAGTPVSRNLQDISAISKMLHDEQIVHTYEDNLRWDHSLLSEPKAVLYTVDRAFHLIPKDGNPAYPGMIRIYGILAPLTFLTLYFLRIRKLPLLNQFATLTLCSVLLPYISYEYTLVVLYLVWAVFLVFLLQDAPALNLPYTRLRTFAILFAATLAPITALSFEHFSGQVKCFLLIALLVAFLRLPMPSTIFGDAIEWKHQQSLAGEI